MGISWIIVIAAALCLLQHRLFSRFGFAGLRVERTFNKTHCHVGDEVEMIETIVNRKPLPVPWLRLESMIHAGLHFGKQTNFAVSSGAIFQNHRSLFSMMPYTKIVRRHHIRCARRGWYKLESAAISVGDIMGLEAAAKTQKIYLELLVYPQLLDYRDIPLPSSRWQGDVIVKRWIIQDPFLSSGVREYRYGDTMSSIHWKATARSGRLQVYNREFTADPRLLIIVNTQITETMWDAVTDPELVEKGISYAATLARHAALQGVPIGFGCNSYTPDKPGTPVFIAPEGGAPQLEYVYETMAKLAVACCRAFHDFLENGLGLELGGTATDVVLITPFVSGKIAEQIGMLEAAGHSVFVVPLEHGIIDSDAEEVAGDHAAS